MLLEVDMVRTLNLTTDVPPDRKVVITLPADVPLGLADIVVVVASHASPSGHTLGDLVRSEFFGMWRERGDIVDSEAFARRLRKEAWKRPE
jgi:hypothetical protein